MVTVCSMSLCLAALGDECQPLPMKPVIVGYDHEWLSVSPLALPSWVSPQSRIFHRYKSLPNVVPFMGPYRVVSNHVSMGITN